MLLWFKEGGVRFLEQYFNELSTNISHQVVLYYDNIVLLRYKNEKQVQYPLIR